MAEPRALVKNAADEEQVRDGQRKEKDHRTTEIDDVFAVLSTLEGRRFLWRLLDHCGVYRTPFALDDRTTNYHIGQGDVGRFLLKEIALANPGALVRMMQEFSPLDAE